ncbi:MAG: hypothetical protein JWO36_2216 [Myxococcales bacterium]|nr:hypothetical protein [Myxococcales bacterium]
MTAMRGWLVLAMLGGHLAHADVPTKKQATRAAEKWMRSFSVNEDEGGDSGKTALEMSSDPFLFDHDHDSCKKQKKAKDIFECLRNVATFEVGGWGPDRVRVHTDAKFSTWQPNRKHDIIEKHRKDLAKLKNHVFVHFTSGANDGAWEVVLAVRLDKDARPIVDAYLASFLPNADKHVDESAAVAVATTWVRALAESDEARKSNAHRTGYPFWEIGLPVGKKMDCKLEESASSAKEMWAISACIAASADLDLLDHLPRSSWEAIEDPAGFKTHADKDSDNFAAALDRLDRLAYDHVFLYNRIIEGDQHFEIVLALRDEDGNPVVDAAVANLY